MTIERLYELCKEEIENGNGSSEIILCVNNNEFYELECGFSSLSYNNEFVYDYMKQCGINIDNEDDFIVLN